MSPTTHIIPRKPVRCSPNEGFGPSRLFPATAEVVPPGNPSHQPLPALEQAGSSITHSDVRTLDLWLEAKKQLENSKPWNDYTQAVLPRQFDDQKTIADIVIGSLKDARENYKDKQWVYMRKNGQRIVFADVVNDIISCITSVKDFGAAAASCDPTKATAVAWAGIQLMVRAATDNKAIRDLVLDDQGSIAHIIQCSATMEENYLGCSTIASSEAGKELRRVLIELYKEILQYHAEAYSYIKEPKIVSGVAALAPKEIRAVQRAMGGIQSKFSAVKEWQQNIHGIYMRRLSSIAVQQQGNFAAIRASASELGSQVETIHKLLLETQTKLLGSKPFVPLKILSSEGAEGACATEVLSQIIKQKDDLSFQGPVGICLGQVPHIPSKLFVGRVSELDEIAGVLHPGNEPLEQRRLVLGGIGGIGKTQLAVAYAKSQGKIYDSTLWLDAASEASLNDSFQSIASHIFNVPYPGALESKEIVRHIHRWLSHPKNTGWLLIFDNYDNPSQFQIDKYLPLASHGAIIVTTRRPGLVAGSQVSVKPLKDMDDSLMILQTRSKRDDIRSDPCAERLAERLAGLPIALATAGAFLHQSSLTFKRYLDEYNKRWNVDPRHPVKLQDYQERTLYTTWDLSYAVLERDDPEAAKFLRLLAYFGNQSLWYELFHAGLTKNSPEWRRKVVADYVNFDGVMRTLTEYCFLEVEPTSESWSMHICVHDWALAALNKQIDIEHYWYAFDCIHASMNGIEVESFGHISYSRLAAHATWLVQQRFLENDIILNASPDQLNMVSRLSRLLLEQVQLSAAEKMYIQELAGKDKTLGLDHKSTLDTVNYLGNLYRGQGKLDKAEQMFLRALAGKEKALGADHTSTLDTVNNLGNMYGDQDKLDMAEQMYNRALAGYEKELGADHTSTLRVVGNLGLLYHNQDKLDLAEQMFNRALAGYEKELGSDHTSTLRAVGNLGLLYYTQDKLDMAEQMFNRALAGYEKELGADHTLTLRAVSGLGLLYHNQDKLDLAEQMYSRVLAGYEKVLGPDHKSTLAIINCLGLLYHGQDKLDMAEQMFNRALAGYEEVFGPDHKSTLAIINCLGLLYHGQDNLDMAEQMFNRALAGYEKAHGADHTLTLDTVSNLGNLYKDQGKLDKAEQMYNRAMGMTEEENTAAILSTQ